MKKAYKNRLSCFVSDSVLVLLGSFGIVLSLTTAYDIRLENYFYYIALPLCLLLTWLITSPLKSIRISGYAVFGSVVLLLAARAFTGMLLFYNTFLNYFKNFLTGLSPVNAGALQLTYSEYFSALFILLCLSLAVIIITALIKYRQIWLCLVLTLPFFSLSLLHLRATPGVLPLILTISFIVSAIAFTFTAEKNNTHYAKPIISFALILVLLFGSISVAFPQSDFRRIDFAEQLYMYFDRIFNFKGTAPTEESRISSNGSFNGSLENAYVDLRDSTTQGFTGATAFYVVSNAPGVHLMRGISFGSYQDSSWRSLDSDVQSSLASLVSYPWNDSSNNRYITQESFAASVVMEYGAEQKLLMVIDAIEPGDLIYTPYYTPSITRSEIEYVGDSFIRASARYINPRFDFYPADAAYTLGTVNSLLNDKEGRYSSYVSRFYTDIDKEMHILLYDTVLKGYTVPEDVDDIIEEVTERVKNYAVYNFDTPAAPQDKDFVQHFLETQEGFCMHFATLGTLAFRASGIPARYVTGYSVYVDENKLYDGEGSYTGLTNRVIDRQAHAWVEVYIDRVGWVPVDVTPGDYLEQVIPQGSGGAVSAPDISEAESSDTSTVSDDSEGQSVVSGDTSEDESEVSGALTGGTSDTSQETSSAIITGGKAPIWLYAVIAVVFAAMLVIVRRIIILHKRSVAFKSESNNKSAIKAWLYICRLLPYGVVPDERIYYLAQRAKFSQHTLTKQELDELIVFANSNAARVDSELKGFKRFVFRYIRGLY